ncbi:hypothetical protein ACIF6L_23710 [Kitasatospora sp. NPDC086009]|uniref:hypothetical protein n=1 Tax=unclassified Kitasatospora TaxID=2633591 RepID=UPI0037CB1069
MSLTTEREREIRALADDESRTTFTLDDAVEDLLAALDAVRDRMRSMAAKVRAVADDIEAGRTPEVAGLRRAAQLAAMDGVER